MRGLVLASLFLAALAHTEPPAGRARKSLGFGPAHPHAVYKSSPYQIQTNGFTAQDPDACPFGVARLFLDDLLRDQLSEANSYTIRDDSYVDKATGIAHIYARQVVNGLEVADGDINLNIKDGVVLSYGNSFYPGTAPAPFAGSSADVAHPHQEFCNHIASTIDSHYAQLQDLDGQIAMTPQFQVYSDHLVRVKADHCDGLEFVPETFAETAAKADITDLRHALLQFMIAATPNSETLNSILSDYDTILDKMNTWMPGTFGPSDNERYMHVENVPDTVNPVKAQMAYIQVPNKAGDATELSLVWKFEVEMQDNWYEAAVSMAAPHRIISVVDWASDAYLAPVPKPEKPAQRAVYTTFPWGVNDPETGNRTEVKENDDIIASPVGWHSLPYTEDPAFTNSKYAVRTKSFYRNTTTTWGNNVFAQENWEGRNAFVDNFRPDAGKGLNFTYGYNPTEVDRSEALAEARSWINNTVTQLFYTSNMVHDIFYRYGFDEQAGNFQQYNFDRGGKGGDGVIANAQDGSGFNNANFMTPPDGQNGRMRMYIWNTANPYRDGDLEAGIVIHELSHGTSTRLTGGPANSGCLGWGESGGMGEGWGDFFATSIRANKKYSDYAMGSWAANKEGGIRNYPYSTDQDVNPSSYKTLDKPGYWGVHAIGEVWAEMLWVVEQRLIEQHGYSDTLYPPQPEEDGSVPEGDFYKPRVGKKPLVPKHGNTLAVQLVLNGMKLQPCRPSFFDARDAIILADQQLTDGENFCTIWKAFGERGLGQDAGVEGKTPWGGGVRTDGFKVPASCKSD